MEIKATSEGKVISYDDGNENVLATHEIALRVIEVATSLPSGLRVGWLSGTNTETNEDVELAVGAGVGSKWGTITIGERSFVFNAMDILEAVGELLDKPAEDTSGSD